MGEQFKPEARPIDLVALLLVVVGCESELHSDNVTDSVTAAAEDIDVAGPTDLTGETGNSDPTVAIPVHGSTYGLPDGNR